MAAVDWQAHGPPVLIDGWKPKCLCNQARNRLWLGTGWAWGIDGET
jgi:hypothetical protein